MEDAPDPPAEPPRVPRSFYRHRLATRIWHWVNALAVMIMIGSGLMIFNAHPRLYWGQYGANFDHPWLQLPRFPGWATIPSRYNLAGARTWHLFFALVLAFALLAFMIASLVNRHFQRDLRIRRAELAPAHLWADLKAHFALRFHDPKDPGAFNIFQKLSYVGVIFGLIPLLILTGLALSPAMDAAWPWLLDVVRRAPVGAVAPFHRDGGDHAVHRRPSDAGDPRRADQRGALDDHPAAGTCPRIPHEPDHPPHRAGARRGRAGRGVRRGRPQPGGAGHPPRRRGRAPGAPARDGGRARARISPRPDEPGLRASTAARTPAPPIMPRMSPIASPTGGSRSTAWSRGDAALSARAAPVDAAARADHPARLRRGLERDRQVAGGRGWRACSISPGCATPPDTWCSIAPIRSPAAPITNRSTWSTRSIRKTILAWAMNGRPLNTGHGAPIRLRVERQLGYKHAKYVMRIEGGAVARRDRRRQGRLLGGFERIPMVCRDLIFLGHIPDGTESPGWP